MQELKKNTLLPGLRQFFSLLPKRLLFAPVSSSEDRLPCVFKLVPSTTWSPVIAQHQEFSSHVLNSKGDFPWKSNL